MFKQRYIYRIDPNSRTGIVSIPVSDDYELQAGDFDSYPAGAYTPIKEENGQLVGATLAEHNAFEAQWFKDHPSNIPAVAKPEPSDAVKANAMLAEKVMTLEAQLNKQQTINAAMMKQIMTLQANK